MIIPHWWKQNKCWLGDDASAWPRYLPRLSSRKSGPLHTRDLEFAHGAEKQFKKGIVGGQSGSYNSQDPDMCSRRPSLRLSGILTGRMHSCARVHVLEYYYSGSVQPFGRFCSRVVCLQKRNVPLRRSERTKINHRARHSSTDGVPTAIGFLPSVGDNCGDWRISRTAVSSDRQACFVWSVSVTANSKKSSRVGVGCVTGPFGPGPLSRHSGSCTANASDTAAPAWMTLNQPCCSACLNEVGGAGGESRLRRLAAAPAERDPTRRGRRLSFARKQKFQTFVIISAAFTPCEPSIRPDRTASAPPPWTDSSCPDPFGPFVLPESPEFEPWVCHVCTMGPRGPECSDFEAPSAQPRLRLGAASRPWLGEPTAFRSGRLASERPFLSGFGSTHFAQPTIVVFYLRQAHVRPPSPSPTPTRHTKEASSTCPVFLVVPACHNTALPREHQPRRTTSSRQVHPPPTFLYLTTPAPLQPNPIQNPTPQSALRLFLCFGAYNSTNQPSSFFPISSYLHHQPLPKHLLTASVLAPYRFDFCASPPASNPAAFSH